MAQLLVRLITVTLCGQGQLPSPKAIRVVSSLNGRLSGVFHQQEVGLQHWGQRALSPEVRAPCRAEHGFRRDGLVWEGGSPESWRSFPSSSF